MENRSCDILVIGSGIAGLGFALHCSELFPHKKIVVLSKNIIEESNTRYAQGGIAAVMDQIKDSYEEHIRDTLIAGDGLCDKKIVEMVVKEAPSQMTQLMDWGVNFDRKNNQLDLGREGGHSTNRILHCKDHTGESISSSLLKVCRSRDNIELLEKQFVLKLNTSHTHNGKICMGAIVKNGTEIYSIYSHYTMMAGGGAGRIYKNTTNPSIATGDGIALAYEAGADLKNMAFVQFHPTLFYQGEDKEPFLISEAVRGFGAVLRNRNGEEFMHHYDARGSLATRDVVSRAIFSEMQKENSDHLWLDLRHIDYDEFALNFPKIAAHLFKSGLDVRTDMIPIVPAAHYFCGGIETDNYGQTSLQRLYACGECACTGLHGANRLASNSLLEALVFSGRAAKNLQQNFSPLVNFEAELNIEFSTQPLINLDNIKNDLLDIMSSEVGIVRSMPGLLKAKNIISEYLSKFPANTAFIEIKELQNMLITSLAVINDSLDQKNNCGGFYREEFLKKEVEC